jgi:CheY-like chemotaxis protein
MKSDPAKRLQVWVVDDDHGTRVALRDLLEEAGYLVVTAAHGRQALELLRAQSEPPDLVILDLQMPLMDGWTLVEVLKAHPVWRLLPIIAYTAITADRRPPPVDALLRKPVPGRELLDTIRRCVELPRPTSDRHAQLTVPLDEVPHHLHDNR